MGRGLANGRMEERVGLSRGRLADLCGLFRPEDPLRVLGEYLLMRSKEIEGGMKVEGGG